MNEKRYATDRLVIIAGPCSVDESNIAEIYGIAKIVVQTKTGEVKRAVAGTRVVGLKSRTNFSRNGNIFLGIDAETHLQNIETFYKWRDINKLKVLPSILIANKIQEDTNLLIATEIVSPSLQLPLYEDFQLRKLLLWNPSVNQLGWPIYEVARYCSNNNWFMGIKNGRWLDKTFLESEAKEIKEKTNMEKTWEGLVEYGDLNKDRIRLIYRGVDVAGKKNYRNLPLHQLAARVKKSTNCLLFFDPSHSFGPKLRDEIVGLTTEVMKLRLNGDDYLYDGILIEVGTSKSDTNQHISLEELQVLANKLFEFRQLVSPDENI